MEAAQHSTHFHVLSSCAESSTCLFLLFDAEIRVLRTLHHRNIITCYEW
jgi:hypothetical protein